MDPFLGMRQKMVLVPTVDSFGRVKTRYRILYWQSGEGVLQEY